MGYSNGGCRVKLMFFFASVTVLLSGCSNKFVVLDPKGPVAQMEQQLIILSVILCSIVVVPVLLLLVFIVWRYRDKPDNKAPYMPDWKNSKVLETIWWVIPIIIIGILGTYTVKGTHALVKPLVTNAKPITIQVTSLDWKWLFQYPGQHIATVNYVQIPAGVPIQFELTSAAPINSFWVPQLGGQEYSMPGMSMRLWLQADEPGMYYGTGANFSGKQFAHMRFTVEAKTQTDFNRWVEQTRKQSPELTMAGYEQLQQPGTVEKMLFSSYPPGLYEDTVQKYGGIYMPDGGMRNERPDN